MTKRDNRWIVYRNEQILNETRERGIIILDNQSYHENGIQFTGITLPYEFYEIEKESKKGLEKYLSKLALLPFQKEEF